MTDDLVGQLRQFQRYAAGLESRLESARAQAPVSADGSDRSGVIHATVGADGLLQQVWIDEDWQAALRPQAVGPAILEADQDASGRWLAEWSEILEDQGWRTGADRLRPDDVDIATETGPAALPTGWRQQIEQVQPRPLEELTEDVLRALDAAGDSLAAVPLEAIGTGHDHSGRLSVTLSTTGLVSCTAETVWTSGQRGSSLTAAVAQALVAARLHLSHALESQALEAPAPATGLDHLLVEALAILNDSQRLADS